MSFSRSSSSDRQIISFTGGFGFIGLMFFVSGAGKVGTISGCISTPLTILEEVFDRLGLIEMPLLSDFTEDELEVVGEELGL
jgi:hypothetical protein